jgi:2-dehydro-3-deoxygluconokinase
MSEQRPVICVGEVLIELARGNDGRFALSCNGDTFNTAIYLARAGIGTAFASALGDDPYSDGLIALATAEGVGCDLVVRVPGRLPGLTVIDTDPAGGRRLFAWRDADPARDLFELPQWSRVAEALMGARMVYFSGITLSLYSNLAIGRFLAALELARQRGTKIVFDGNFRARDWNGDRARTRTVFMEALKRCDIALPTYDDEAVLWGDPSPEATVERMRAFGIGEIVVKNGPHSALVASPHVLEHVPVPELLVPVDQTAAGDGFNAGYLAARLTGATPVAGATAAHRLAGEVIRHPGALTPRAGAAMH